MTNSIFKVLARVFCLFVIAASPVLAQVKFLDAAQIRPILDATKGQWVAVREYGGQDLLYFTHLLAWRCGLDGVRYSINGAEEMTDWPLTPCDEEAANPAAIPDTQQIYTGFPLKSLETISVEITYDDGATDTVTYGRKAIQIN